MAHEEAPRRTDTIHDPHAEIANRADGRDIVGEQARQRVGRGGKRKGIEAPPALIALQYIELPEIESQPRGIENDLRQRGRILEPEIQPLTRDRMDAMRRVACERETR